MIMIIILILIIVILFGLLIYFNYNSLVSSSEISDNKNNNESSTNEVKIEDEADESKEVTLDTFLYDAVIRMSDSDIEDIEKADFDNKKVEKLIKDRFIKKTENKASFYYSRVYNPTKNRLRVKNYIDTIIGNMQNGDHNKLKQIIGHNKIVTINNNLNNVSIFVDKILKELASNEKKYLKDKN
tara:strand:+ start:810 stop:1361 length:552 start_codon:yes stop_codon:yes gene_type:complete